MRTRVALSVAAALAAAIATLGLASPASAGPVFHLVFNGRVAIGSWTTCPQPKVGDTCLDTVVIASDAKSYENSDQPTGGHFLHSKGDRVILRHFWYTITEFEGELFPRTTRESFGGTDVGVSVSITNRLTRASAVAPSIPMRTFDYVNDTESEETGSVSVTWQPAGPLEPVREGGRTSTRDYLMKSSTKGWSRMATAGGTDGGAPIAGSVVQRETVMYSVRQAELSVYKGQPAG